MRDPLVEIFERRCAVERRLAVERYAEDWARLHRALYLPPRPLTLAEQIGQWWAWYGGIVWLEIAGLCLAVGAGLATYMIGSAVLT